MLGGLFLGFRIVTSEIVATGWVLLKVLVRLLI